MRELTGKVRIVTHLAKALVLTVGLGLLGAAGCTSTPVRQAAPAKVPDTLVVHEDGRMVLGDRLMAAEDVVIYPDGYGGEKAAVRVRLQPLHPDFFRDTIIVERR